MLTFSSRRTLVALIHRAFEVKPPSTTPSSSSSTATAAAAPLAGPPPRDAGIPLVELARVSHNTTDVHLVSVVVGHILRLKTRTFSPLRYLVGLVESPSTPSQITIAAAYLLAYVCSDALNEETMAQIESERVLSFLLVAHNMRNNQEHPSHALSICAWALSNIAQAAVLQPDSPVFRTARQTLRATTVSQVMRVWRREDLRIEDRIYALQYIGVLSQTECNPNKLIELGALAGVRGFIIREAASPDLFVNADFPLRYRLDLRVRAVVEAVRTLGLLLHHDPTTAHLGTLRLSVIQDAAFMRALTRCVECSAPDPASITRTRSNPAQQQAVSPALLPVGAAPQAAQFMPPPVAIAMPTPTVAAPLSALLGGGAGDVNMSAAAPFAAASNGAAAAAAAMPAAPMDVSTPSLSSSMCSSPAAAVAAAVSAPVIVSTPLAAPSPVNSSRPAQQRSVFVPADARESGGFFKIARHPYHVGLHSSVALVLANCFLTASCVASAHANHRALISSLTSLISVPGSNPHKMYGALALANMASCRDVFAQVSQDTILLDAVLDACGRPASQSSPVEDRFLVSLLFNLVQDSPVNILRVAGRGAAKVLAQRFVNAADSPTRRIAGNLMSLLCGSPVLVAVLVGADCLAPLDAADVELIARAGLWCTVKNLEAFAPALINAGTQMILNNGRAYRKANSADQCSVPLSPVSDAARRCPHCLKGKQAAPQETKWKRHKRTRSVPDEYAQQAAPHSHSPVPRSQHQFA